MHLYTENVTPKTVWSGKNDVNVGIIKAPIMAATLTPVPLYFMFFGLCFAFSTSTAVHLHRQCYKLFMDPTWVL